VNIVEFFKLRYLFLLVLAISLAFLSPINNTVFATDGSAITEVANQEHADSETITYNSLIQLDSDTYVLAYTDAAGDGFIQTFTISADGTEITEVSNEEHNTSDGTHHSAVMVDSDTYLVAYASTSDMGKISTHTISAAGTITETNIIKLEHETTKATYNSLVHVDSTTYALAYTGPGDDGFIQTFTVPSDGSAITEVANQEHNESDATHNSLVHVDSTTYALAYASTGNMGKIDTFTISADGTGITEITSLEHEAVQATYNSLVQVDSDTYALAYTGANDKGFIQTFTISADGTTITEVANLAIAYGDSTHNSLVQVDSDTYALAYTGANDKGYIQTFTISADGTTITEVANLAIAYGDSTHNSLVQVDSDTYALAYTGADGDGFIQTFTIPYDGSTIKEVKTTEHDASDATYNSLVQVDSDTYALAYTGVASDGFIQTFTISGNVPVETASTGGGGGGNQSCNSKGFGVGKSLAVYEVSYNLCGDNRSVDILAYSTCGGIKAQLTTEYGTSSVGLSSDQPFIDDETTAYTGVLRDDIKSFTVKMENKRNEFEDKFVINECKGTKNYSQITGYTSSQQGTSADKGIVVSVPTWVKNTAGWWADDKISEGEFVKGVEFLIKERIIDNIKTGAVESSSSSVPEWVKNNAGWWSDGQIDDDSFVKGIEYLVKVGLIQVSSFL